MELRLVAIVALSLLWSSQSAFGIRFVIDREECFSTFRSHTKGHSFCVLRVIKYDTLGARDDGVDLVVKGPTGEQIRDSRGKTSDMFDFTVRHKGLHRFCFVNKSPYHETIQFDVHVAHFAYYEHHAKDGESQRPALSFSPFDSGFDFCAIYSLENWKKLCYNIQFEQHWLEAQTERQALSEGWIIKALFESGALVGVSAFQLFLLRRLFEKKLGNTRV
ncbi:unnamed protein product [Spirodela intermedia]|uniref:GOLD domain-containing protein n=1 Tax=Spirodela intermedia TaxID=51605 RepID=A0A7I8JMK9_SPIIN|nr:unnamed protein product [Spirodela intermedia]CAA6670702.1 unnamed protein product [Spirodela intermedia]